MTQDVHTCPNKLKWRREHIIVHITQIKRCGMIYLIIWQDLWEFQWCNVMMNNCILTSRHLQWCQTQAGGHVVVSTPHSWGFNGSWVVNGALIHTSIGHLVTLKAHVMLVFFTSHLMAIILCVCKAFYGIEVWGYWGLQSFFFVADNAYSINDFIQPVYGQSQILWCPLWSDESDTGYPNS